MHVYILINRESTSDIEDRVRRSIRDIVSCNLAKAQSFGFLEQLFPVDCITSCFTLEAVATDNSSYTKLLRKLAKCLKPGGILFLTGTLNQEGFQMGSKEFFCLDLTPEFVESAVKEAGFSDIEMERHEIEQQPKTSTIIKEYFLLTACKP